MSAANCAEPSSPRLGRSRLEIVRDRAKVVLEVHAREVPAGESPAFMAGWWHEDADLLAKALTDLLEMT